ncbi:MAG: putative RDD family membrane protein YckC [Oceanicoccus sp.]|jgi:uncharacterized RDD family membrane protein YckC
MSDQQNTLTVTNAGLFVRLAALLYDALLVLGLWFAIGVVFVIANGGEAANTHNPFLPSALFIATLWFNMHFWRRGGQTLGMRAWRLRLLNQNKGPLTMTQCLLRFVVAIGSLGLCGIGYLWMFIDKDGFTWHDKYSETRVIREPKKITA